MNVPLPPVAARFALKGTLTSERAAAMPVPVIFTASRTTIVYACVSERVGSRTASAVNVYEPTVVGVPVMAPLAGSSASPGGSWPDGIDQVTGLDGA